MQAAERIFDGQFDDVQEDESMDDRPIETKPPPARMAVRVPVFSCTNWRLIFLARRPLKRMKWLI
jgi:hypothetical protein